MSNLPALVASSDLLPEGGPLNGRRLAGQTLLWLWSKYSASDPLALLSSKDLKAGFERFSRLAGHRGKLNILDFINPAEITPYGALFLPDPSIGRWAHWRALCGPAKFSLIGQIHTLSTPVSMRLMQELVTEPIKPWDALICSSHAGKAVVQGVLDDREEQLLNRFQQNIPANIERPQLPVIPLPIDTEQIQKALPSKISARKNLGLDPNAHVVLWLGRLSMLTKLDPWPTYLALEQAALLLKKPLILIECGPDDSPHQAIHFNQLKSLCPHVNFARFGGDKPVSESTKYQCMASSDIAISLVDNTQETFGLSVAEAMASGLPVVASNWNGYRDLIRDGIDGFLIPTKWSSSAHDLSTRLGWASSLGIMNYPMSAGCLAQLVQIDLSAAVAAIVSLLTQPAMLRAMSEAAKFRAEKHFGFAFVMAKYIELFELLKEKRQLASEKHQIPQKPSITINPVQAFTSYPSSFSESIFNDNMECNDLPEVVKEGRSPLWNELKNGLPSNLLTKLEKELLLKHQINKSNLF